MKTIITGAASGIGAATARRFAREAQAELVLTDRDSDGLDRIAGQARELGACVETFRADIAEIDAAHQIVDVAERSLGGLDALISNAGALFGAPLLELDVQKFDQLFAINTRPTWLLAKAAHPMLSRSAGAIVATGSISGVCATPPLGSYSATKAALIMLVEQMALEWGRDGIRANCVSPGSTLTPLTAGGYADPVRKAQREANIPLRRLGAPEDVAEAIFFLASPAARQISGVNLLVDGGMSKALMPATGAGTGQAQNG